MGRPRIEDGPPPDPPDPPRVTASSASAAEHCCDSSAALASSKAQCGQGSKAQCGQLEENPPFWLLNSTEKSLLEVPASAVPPSGSSDRGLVGCRSSIGLIGAGLAVMTRVRIGFGSPIPLPGSVLANACSLELIEGSSRSSLAISSVTAWASLAPDGGGSTGGSMGRLCGLGVSLLPLVHGAADQPLLVLSIGSEQVDASTLILNIFIAVGSRRITVSTNSRWRLAG